MRSFYIATEHLAEGDVVDLPGDLRRHMQTVLRLGAGETVELFNDTGLVARAELLDEVSARLVKVVSAPEPACVLTLIQGLPKGEKAELILQKGTELGVNHFYLAAMERSVSQIKNDRKEKKLQRWLKIMQEAARQCRQYHLPTLQAGQPLQEIAGAVDAELKLVLWEGSCRPLEECLPSASPKSVAVVVGPEGGIAGSEVEMLEGLGYDAVSLGPRILRTETAGLAIMSVLQYLYGDLASGQHG